MQKKISVVIPVYNGAKTISALLDSLLRTEAEMVDIIVVDDGSTDGTMVCLEKYPIKIIRLPGNRGGTYSRNRGLEAVTTRYVAFIDADCVAPDGWASRALNEFDTLRQSDNRIVAMSGRVLPYTNSFYDRLTAYIEHWEYQNGELEERLKLSTSVCICDRAVLMAVGGFDERLVVDEDRELALRLYTLGYKTIYDPAVFILHNHGRSSFAAVLKHQFFWGINTGLINEWRYGKIRKLWFLKYIRHALIYFLIIPWLAAAITWRIVRRIFPLDRRVLVMIPWIFAIKVAYRCGVLAWMIKHKNKMVEHP